MDATYSHAERKAKRGAAKNMMSEAGEIEMESSNVFVIFKLN